MISRNAWEIPHSSILKAKLIAALQLYASHLNNQPTAEPLFTLPQPEGALPTAQNEINWGNQDRTNGLTQNGILKAWAGVTMRNSNERHPQRACQRPGIQFSSLCFTLGREKPLWASLFRNNPQRRTYQGHRLGFCSCCTMKLQSSTFVSVKWDLFWLALN